MVVDKLAVDQGTIYQYMLSPSEFEPIAMSAWFVFIHRVKNN